MTVGLKELSLINYMENKSFQIKKRITKINASISKLDVTFNIQKSEWSSKKIRKGKNIQVTNTVFKREKCYFHINNIFIFRIRIHLKFKEHSNHFHGC